MISEEKPIVLVYRSELIKYSEPWILTQAESFKRYTPFYLYSHRVEQLAVPAERIIKVEISNFWKPNLPFSLGPKLGCQQLLERLSYRRPVLLYAHFGPDAVEALPIAESLRIPLVVAFHGYDASYRDDVFRRGNLFLRRYLFWRELLKERASLIVADSDYVASQVIRQGFSEKKVKVQHLGADLDLFKKDDGSVRKPQVLFVGRLVAKKGCELLLRAMRIVQDKFPLVKLIITGDGEEKNNLTLLATQLRLNIEFLGSVEHRQVHQLMNESLIFCLPSQITESGNSEGLPVVLIEAQACGCSIVTSRHSGIPDGVIESQTAELIDPGNIPQLAKALETFLSSSERRELAAKVGPEFVAEKFNAKKLALQLEDTFDELILRHWNANLL